MTKHVIMKLDFLNPETDEDLNTQLALGDDTWVNFVVYREDGDLWPQAIAKAIDITRRLVGDDVTWSVESREKDLAGSLTAEIQAAWDLRSQAGASA